MNESVGVRHLAEWWTSNIRDLTQNHWVGVDVSLTSQVWGPTITGLGVVPLQVWGRTTTGLGVVPLQVWGSYHYKSGVPSLQVWGSYHYRSGVLPIQVLGPSITDLRSYMQGRAGSWRVCDPADQSHSLVGEGKQRESWDGKVTWTRWLWGPNITHHPQGKNNLCK